MNFVAGGGMELHVTEAGASAQPAYRPSRRIGSTCRVGEVTPGRAI
jgi:hypothetical protein